MWGSMNTQTLRTNLSNLTNKLSVPLGVLLLGACGVAMLFWWSGKQGTEEGAVIHAAEQALAAGKAYRTRQAKLQEVAQRALNRATVAIAADRAKDASVRELTVRLASQPNDSTRVIILRQLVDTLMTQRDSARAAIGALLIRMVADSARANAAEIRVAELERHLHATLVIAQCRWLGIRFLPKCPSRTVSAVLGFGVGASVILLTQSVSH